MMVTEEQEIQNRIEERPDLVTTIAQHQKQVGEGVVSQRTQMAYSRG